MNRTTAHKGFRRFAKRAVAMTAVVLMLLAFVPAAAFAVEAGHSHSGYTALEWSGSGFYTGDGKALGHIIPAGKYYLTNDAEITNYQLTLYGGVTLCLNGYTITLGSNSAYGEKSQPIKVEGDVTIECCKGNGKIHAEDHLVSCIEMQAAEAVLNLKGGTITADGKSKTTTKEKEGVIYAVGVWGSGDANVIVDGAVIKAAEGTDLPAIHLDDRSNVIVKSGEVIGDTYAISDGSLGSAYNDITVEGGTVTGRKDYAIKNDNLKTTGDPDEVINITGGTVGSEAKEALNTNIRLYVSGAPKFESGAATGAHIRVTGYPLYAYKQGDENTAYSGTDTIIVSSAKIESLYDAETGSYTSGETAAGSVLVKGIAEANKYKFDLPEVSVNSEAYDIYGVEIVDDEIRLWQSHVMITFDGNGVDNMPVLEHPVSMGYRIDINHPGLEFINREAHVFSHWCTDADCTNYDANCENAWKLDEPVNTNLTLTAIFEPYTINVQLENGSLRVETDPAATAYQWYEITGEATGTEQAYVKEGRWVHSATGETMFVDGHYEESNFNTSDSSWSPCVDDEGDDIFYLELNPAFMGKYQIRGDSFPEGKEPVFVNMWDGSVIHAESISNQTYTFKIKPRAYNNYQLKVLDAFSGGYTIADYKNIFVQYYETKEVIKAIEGETDAVLEKAKINTDHQYYVEVTFSDGSTAESERVWLDNIKNYTWQVYIDNKIVDNGNEIVYDGKSHSIRVEVGKGAVENVTIKYWNGNGFSTEKPTFTDVGEYKISYQVNIPFTYDTDEDNYSSVGTYTLKITPANPVLKVTACDGLTYTGADQALVVNNTAAEMGTVKYALGNDAVTAPEEDAWSETLPTGKNVGTYYVWYRCEASEKGNYKSSDPAVCTVTIAKASLNASNVTLSAEEFTYNGAEQKPAVTVTLNGSAVPETDYSISWPSEDYISAGEKKVTVTFTGSSINSASVTKTYQINQKEIGLDWQDGPFYYTGEYIIPTATATGVVAGDDVSVVTALKHVWDAGNGTIPGTWTAAASHLNGEDSANYKLPANKSYSYTILNAQQDAPSGVVVDKHETLKGKADGKISGLTAEMEYSADGESYIPVTDAVINGEFAAGTYYVRYAAKEYHDPSEAVTVTVEAGAPITVVLPAEEDQIGYTLTSDKSELAYGETFTLTLTVKDGYSMTEDFAVTLNGVSVDPWPENNVLSITAEDDTQSYQFALAGIADITAPTASITVAEKKWNTFLNDITFGLLFNKTQEVRIDFADAGSGINTCEYCVSSEALSYDDAVALNDWEEYNGTFRIDPNNKYVIYAKVSDNAGNTVYVSSDGMILDATAPALQGIENGQTYYGDVEVALNEDAEAYDSITLDGEEMIFTDGKATVIADNKEHTVVVEDKFGNTLTYTVTVMKKYAVTFIADGKVIATQSIGHGLDAAAPAIPEKVGYDKTAPAWDHDGKNITEDTTIKAVYTINKYNVTFTADGKVVDTQTVEHGADATLPKIPAKKGYDQTAPAWDKDGKNITADTTIKAVYTVNKYTVTFTADGKVVDTQTVEHGADAALPEIPAKKGYDETAPAWDKDGKNITADTTINAVYTVNKYTVTFTADGKVVDTQTVEHGADAVLPNIPAKEGYDETAPYWDKDGKNITADTTVKAVYTANKPADKPSDEPATHTHTVTFTADGKVIAAQTVEHGADAALPNIPAKKGYNETAPAWDHDGKNITEDITIKAVYTKNEPGELVHTTPATNVGGGTLAEDIDKLKETVPFTEEELWDMEHGTDADVWIEIRDISPAIAEEDKKLIEQKLGAHTVGIYLDICMFKQVGDSEAVKLSDLNDHVTVTMKVPDSLMGDAARTYKIIRVHDGAAEVIDTVFDKNTNTISFETDRFSTYALTYRDAADVSDTPSAGDFGNPWLWTALLALCGICLIGIVSYHLKTRSAKGNH